jgi:EAL domain-containing protein (putative c-di-GMP-specific phosphodiesterase class I)
MRLHSVSLYNVDADVLWLSEGALGPDEHNVVIEAIETQKNEKAQPYYEFGMEDGRMAVFLPIRGPRNDLAGTVMILADMKSMTEGTMERIVTPQVRTILVKIAMFMRKNAPAAAAPDAPPDIAMPTAAAAPAPVNLSSTTVIEKLPAHAAANLAAAAAGPTLGPREVEQILELELVAEPPRAPAADVGAAPSPGGKAAAAGPAGKKTPPAPAKGNARGAASAPAAGAAARGGTPTLAAVPTMPARDVEVLAFEPDLQIPTAKSAMAPPAEVEVLAFEVEPPVVSAAPPAAQVPAAPTPVSQAPAASPAAATKPASTGSTSSVRAINVTPAASASTASVRAISAATSAATSNAAKASTGAAPTHSAPNVAGGANAHGAAATGSNAAIADATAPGHATSSAPTGTGAHGAPTARGSQPSSSTPSTPAAASPKPRAARPSISSTQTAAVQIVSDDADIPHLISDTGPVPVLAAPSDDETSIEVAPPLPPLEPLSVEESATDLTLFAQELIKLRSSGRTRRYEVLARSQRDAHRNEVPAAFVAESARGKDGAALDALVLERLLTWLGKHGEPIWDSEPASFSVNLSIGAIEDEGFPQRIEQWLTQHNVPAEYIGFEITEFACVQCKPAVQRFVAAVEKMGCFWVIDNFSFDSSIFEMLGSKALRHVKLDPKVTTAAMKDKLPQALVVAILQACKVLGVHCVAKRVESQSSMQWLTAVGCDFAQSFSLHKPLPLEALASGQPIKALRE